MTPADTATNILSLLWEASWQGGVLVAVIAGVSRVLRVPPRFAAWLWWGVLLKFTLSLLLPLLFGEHALLHVPVSLPPLIAALFPSAPVSTAATAAPSLLLQGLVTFWCFGVCSSLLFVLWRVFGARRIAVTSQSVPETIAASLKQETEQIATSLGLPTHQVPDIKVSSSTKEPGPRLLAAFPRPLILFPGALLPPSPDAMDTQERRLVLAHELSHVRRGDLWLGLLPVLTRCLFFFHPLVYLAHQEWEAAREEACDAMALSLEGESATNTARYGALLLRLGSAQRSQTTQPSVAGVGLLPSPLFHALRRRLNHLEERQKRSGKYRHILLPLFQGVATLILGIGLLPVRPEFIYLPSSQQVTEVPEAKPLQESITAPSKPIRANIRSIKSPVVVARPASLRHPESNIQVAMGSSHRAKSNHPLLSSSATMAHKTGSVPPTHHSLHAPPTKAMASIPPPPMMPIPPSTPQPLRTNLPAFNASEPELATIHHDSVASNPSVNDLPVASAPATAPAVATAITSTSPATTGISADTTVILRNGLRFPRQSSTLSGTNTTAVSRSANPTGEDIVRPIIPIPSPSPVVEMPARETVPLPRSSQPDSQPLRK